MLLEVLLEGVLLRDDPGIVVVVDVVQVVVRVVGGGVLVLPVLGVVQLLVREVIESEVAGGARRVHRSAFAGRETQHRAHLRGGSSTSFARFVRWGRPGLQ